MKKFRFVLPFLVLFGCQVFNNDRKPDLCFSEPFYQEITQLKIGNISNLERLDGKFVQMQGVLRFDFEDVAIYPNSSNNPNDAFWLEFELPNDSALLHVKKLSGKNVKLVGRVNLHKKGHLGSYIATLDSVFCVK